MTGCFQPFKDVGLSLFLASQSPRRREILQQIGVSFETLSVDVDETPLTNESPTDYVERLASGKARAGHQLLPVDQQAMPVLGADTIVLLDGQIMGKPADLQSARQMLMQLSGRQHIVLSSVALVNQQIARVDVSQSTVTFRTLTAAMIDAYWQTGEPCDKAGSYGIQGYGAVFVEKLEGSYSGVMGLPIEKLVPMLNEFAVPYWQS